MDARILRWSTLLESKSGFADCFGLGDFGSLSLLLEISGSDLEGTLRIGPSGGAVTSTSCL